MTLLEQLQADQAELMLKLQVRYDHSQALEDTYTSVDLTYAIQTALLEEALHMLNAMIDYMNIRNRKDVETLPRPG